MIEPKENEDRLTYLARVLHHFMNQTGAGELTIEYDDTTCDGYCLATDIMSELDMCPNEVD